MLVAGAGIGIAWAYYQGKLPQGLSERNALAGAGKRFLVNKYYLDYLYEQVIVGRDQGPDRDRRLLVQPERHRQRPELRRQGRAGRRPVHVRLRRPKGVDGVVNGLATLTGESGGEVRKIQTGRLQFYALMLVAAVVIFAGALWIFT